MGFGPTAPVLVLVAFGAGNYLRLGGAPAPDPAPGGETDTNVSVNGTLEVKVCPVESDRFTTGLLLGLLLALLLVLAVWACKPARPTRKARVLKRHGIGTRDGWTEVAEARR